MESTFFKMREEYFDTNARGPRAQRQALWPRSSLGKSTGFHKDVLAAGTDCTQDLLVGVSAHIEDYSDFQIRIGSLKDRRLGHPMAREALLPASALTACLVLPSRFTLIDNAHFAIMIEGKDNQISVYRFVADTDRAASPNPQFTLCVPGADVHAVPNKRAEWFFIQDISVSLPLPPAVRRSDSDSYSDSLMATFATHEPGLGRALDRPRNGERSGGRHRLLLSPRAGLLAPCGDAPRPRFKQLFNKFAVHLATGLWGMGRRCPIAARTN
ncbi:hypothetical protein V8D89_012686 [Ganoderma adspersum]